MTGQHQWQAQPVAQPAGAAAVSDFCSELPSDILAPTLLAVAPVLLPPFLKSVAYQPLPLN